MTGTTQDRLLTYAEAIREATDQEMARDDTVFVMGLDVDDFVAIQGTTAGLVEKYGAGRCFGTPLSEDAMTGIALGAAQAGLRPIHVHIRMDFVLLCMNQLMNMAAKTHYMYAGAFRAPMVVRTIIGRSWGQGPQHSQALHSLFAHVPGLKVVAPSNAHDAKGCLTAAIRDDNPVIFTEHRLLYYTEAYVPDESFEVKAGRSRVVAPGTDITLVGVSNMVVECLRAREILAEVGISAEVIDPIWLQPLDADTILASASKTGRLLVVDNAWTNCGISAEILARVAEGADPSRPIAMKRMGFAETPCPTTPALEKGFYASPVTVAQMAHRMVDPTDTHWAPDPALAELAHHKQFKGPF